MSNLSCANCHIGYDDGEHFPTMLGNCGHTFCRKCCNTLSNCSNCKFKINKNNLKENMAVFEEVSKQPKTASLPPPQNNTGNSCNTSNPMGMGMGHQMNQGFANMAQQMAMMHAVGNNAMGHMANMMHPGMNMGHTDMNMGNQGMNMGNPGMNMWNPGMNMGPNPGMNMGPNPGMGNPGMNTSFNPGMNTSATGGMYPNFNPTSPTNIPPPAQLPPCLNNHPMHWQESNS